MTDLLPRILSPSTASSMLHTTKRHRQCKWRLVVKARQKVNCGYYATSNHGNIFKQKGPTDLKPPRIALIADPAQQEGLCMMLRLWATVGYFSLHQSLLWVWLEQHGPVVWKSWTTWILRIDKELSITSRPHPLHATGSSLIKCSMTSPLETVALLCSIVNSYLNSPFSEMLFWFAQHQWIEED